MINESFKSMLGAKSVIRELSEYATDKTSSGREYHDTSRIHAKSW